MKKYSIYAALLAVGLLVGWMLFGGTKSEEKEHDHTEQETRNQKWTCSMHPQIMQTEAGDCPICGMDLISAEVGAEGLAADQFKLTKNAMALANIQTSIVGNGASTNNTVKLSGKIVENEEANVVQVSYFSGRIEQLNISSTGEKIQKGQLLARIYSPELYAAQQELITAASLKESQAKLYQAVRNKLKLWKLSESQINQIEKTGKVKENFPVYATVSGTVTEKLVEQGDYLEQGQPLLKIANLSSVWANFDVYENQINLFKKGQEVSVIANSDPNKKYKATVDFIDPALDAKTRTVKLRVVLKNTNNRFKPGMFVEGYIKIIAAKKQPIVIPASAVLWTGKRSVVYLKVNTNEPIFQMQEVLLGNRLGDQYEVIEGLFTGNEIVTNGTFTVDAAAQLQGKKSMMNKSGGKVMTGHEGHIGMTKKADEIKMNTDRVSVDSKFQKQLKEVFDQYIVLKDALIKEDAKTATVASSMMLKKVTLIDMKLLKGEAHTTWMQLSKELKKHTIAFNSTTEIETQRNHFKPLSSSLIMIIEKFGINQKVYSQFCPMADNNTGGYWLSLEDKVVNPYFGNAMLTCGEVTKTIK